MNYYEHHIGDYDAATAHLSMLEDAAYSRLLRLYYRKEAPIPADVATVCRLIRANTKDERKAVETVLQEFFALTDDGWRQRRCDTDIGRYQAKAEKNREVGKLGGRPRKTETVTVPENNHGGFFQEPKQNPPQTPDTSNQTANPPSVPPEPRASRSAETAQGTRLPDNWEPDDVSWKFAAERLGGAARACITLDSFRDYWASKPGKDGRKSDWQATWRNWIRRETSTHGIHSASRTGSTPQPRKLSAVEQVRQACGLDEFDRPLVENDPGLRPQMAEQLWPEADGFLEGDFRAVS